MTRRGCATYNAHSDQARCRTSKNSSISQARSRSSPAGRAALGLEIATRRSARPGQRSSITARREPWLASAEPDASKPRAFSALRGRPCDVSQPDQVSAAAVGRVLERFGRIDILVNNAGISWGELGGDDAGREVARRFSTPMSPDAF